MNSPPLDWRTFHQLLNSNTSKTQPQLQINLCSLMQVINNNKLKTKRIHRTVGKIQSLPTTNQLAQQDTEWYWHCWGWNYQEAEDERLNFQLFPFIYLSFLGHWSTVCDILLAWHIFPLVQQWKSKNRTVCVCVDSSSVYMCACVCVFCRATYCACSCVFHLQNLCIIYVYVCISALTVR